jgi:hypothetical protein
VLERYVAVNAETVKCVWRYRDHVSRFRSDLDPIERVDAASRLYDKHVPMSMAMLRRTSARRIGSPRGRYRDSPIVKKNASRRPSGNGLEGLHIRCFDERRQRFDH